MSSRDQTLFTDGKPHLPFPTGPCRIVGTYDVLTGQNADDRVLVRLFYPAKAQTSDPADAAKHWPNWFPDDNYKTAFAKVGGLRMPLLIHLAKYFIGDVHIPVWPNAEPRETDLDGKGLSWPVVVFSHGIISCRATYSTLCSELASYGFVVANVEHSDQSALYTVTPDEANPGKHKPLLYRFWKTITDPEVVRPQQLATRVADVRKTLDFLERLNEGKEFRNLFDVERDSVDNNNSRPLLSPPKPDAFRDLLDLSKVVIMGHSFGGASVVGALPAEPRLKLGVCLDGWMYPLSRVEPAAVTQPILFLNNGKFQSRDNLTKMSQFVDGIDPVDRRVVTIVKGKHTDQADIPFAIRNRWIKMASGQGSILDPFWVHDVTVGEIFAFFDRHLGMKLSAAKKVPAITADAIYEGIQLDRPDIPKAFKMPSGLTYPGTNKNGEK